MRVLVTNDDGVRAPGLLALAEAAREVFDEVVVVAPATEMSGVGQGLTLHAPLRVEEHGPGVYAVTGTPVDCVIVALGHVFGGETPDLVLSGINRGPNLGHDVYYSGTVGAAREGLIRGIPSLAFSLVGRRHFPFDAVGPAVRRLLRWARDGGVGTDYLLNVNIPAPEAGPEAGPDGPAGAASPGWAGVPGLRGVQVTRLGHRAYGNEVISRDDPRGLPYLWIGGNFPRMEDHEGTDCRAVADGYVSVTPVGLDTTHAAAGGALAVPLDDKD